MLSIGTASNMDYLKNGVAKDTMEYYAGQGEKRGRWAGKAAESLGLVGVIDPDEPEMSRLYDQGIGPDGGQLGRKFPKFKSWEQRADDRIARAETPSEEQIRSIREQEQRRGAKNPCHAYDLTFSPPKSVSALWAISSGEVAAAIEAAQDAAIDTAFEWIEANAAWTRTGATGQHHLRVEGLVASRWEHRTSRSGDPQLHTHCAVFNRAKTVVDGKWRAVDGTSLFAGSAAGNSVYLSALERELTGRLGVAWKNGREAREIVGVPDDLCALWSKRSSDIRARIADYLGNPEERGTIRYGARAHRKLMYKVIRETRDSKPDGPAASPDQLRAGWKKEAEANGFDVAVVLEDVTSVDRPSDAGNVDSEAVLGGALKRLYEGGSVWSTWGIEAAVRNAIPDALVPAATEAPTGVDTDGVVSLRGPDVDLENAVVAELVGEITSWLVNVTNKLVDPDGPAGAQRWTSPALLQAEAELVTAARTPTGFRPPAGPDAIPLLDPELSVSQAAAVLGVATSTRHVDVVVGPAGSGKTTSMGALAVLWGNAGREVVGLTTSQIAADQLATEANITTRNLASWKHVAAPRTGQGLPVFEPGSLVIVDEASMVTTFDLWVVYQAAVTSDAKVLVIGDPMQLDAPGAGGAFGLLCTDNDVPTMTLSEIHRFDKPWEIDASSRLRDGDETVVDVYESHGRIHGGNETDMYHGILDAWRTDRQRGHTVMVTQTNNHASALAAAAREHLVAVGQVDTGPSITLRDGNHASAGDEVRTRKNSRDLTVGSGGSYVRNRDTWTVKTVHRDGSLTVTSVGAGGSTRLPAVYAAQHVELGYAGTAHSVQGVTVDYEHMLCDPDVARQGLYVAMSRGRTENHVWVVAETTEHQEIPGSPVSPTAALKSAIARPISGQTATEAFRERVDYESLRVLQPLAAEQLSHDIAARIRQQLDTSQFDTGDIPRVVVDHARRHWERTGQDPAELISAATAASFEGANDPWAVLAARVETLTNNAPPTRGGASPGAVWMSPTLNARNQAVTSRHQQLAQLARSQPDWVTSRIGARENSRAPKFWDHLATEAVTWADRYSTLQHPDPIAHPADPHAATRLQRLLLNMADYNDKNDSSLSAGPAPAQLTREGLTR